MNEENPATIITVTIIILVFLVIGLSEFLPAYYDKQKHNPKIHTPDLTKSRMHYLTWFLAQIAILLFTTLITLWLMGVIASQNRSARIFVYPLGMLFLFFLYPAVIIDMRRNLKSYKTLVRQEKEERSRREIAAFEELSSGNVDMACWVKAMMKAEWNENRAKSIYIQERTNMNYNADPITGKSPKSFSVGKLPGNCPYCKTSYEIPAELFNTRLECTVCHCVWIPAKQVNATLSKISKKDDDLS